MKNLKSYVLEAFRINQDNKPEQIEHKYFPKKRIELREIINKRLKEDPDVDLNDIDTSNILDMHSLFVDLDPHNIDISEWDVSNVEDMHNMFDCCEYFNCDLSEWDVSNVKDMYTMFFGCKNFEGKNLENWNVSKVSNDDMFGAFYGCKSAPSWYKHVKI